MLGMIFRKMQLKATTIVSVIGIMTHGSFNLTLFYSTALDPLVSSTSDLRSVFGVYLNACQSSTHSFTSLLWIYIYTGKVEQWTCDIFISLLTLSTQYNPISYLYILRIVAIPITTRNTSTTTGVEDVLHHTVNWRMLHAFQLITFLFSSPSVVVHCIIYLAYLILIFMTHLNLDLLSNSL